MRTFNKILSVFAVMLCVLAVASSATASLTYTFTSGTEVAVTGSNYTATGALNVSLGFVPAPGMNLMVVNNTGLAFLNGRFSNVPQGGVVALTYNGITYNFIANYYGGNGRSLVLQWPCTGLVAWGNGSLVPMTVSTSGVLAGKTVVSIGGGDSHSLALTSDGQVFSWGNNYSGQLGNNSTITSTVPVAVNTSEALAGKTVVALAISGAKGTSHSLALTSDGQVFGWGSNHSGELGNNSTTNSLVPVAANTSGMLAGKTVVAISVGSFHSLAVTSDGQVFTWGQNYSGQLGNNSTTSSPVPVAVAANGALSGKKVVAVAGGGNHSLALTSDGLVFAWGNSGLGSSLVPVAVNGALAGKTVVAIAVGYLHSLVLTSDGRIFAWGSNGSGQLGNNTSVSSSVPVAVDTTGALAGKTVVAIAAGASHSLAITSDGLVFAWGANYTGQLGNNSTTSSLVPVPVNTSGQLDGKSATAITAGYSQSSAIFGSGPPSVTINPVNQTAAPGATVTLTAAATDNPAPTVQWQVSTTGTAGTFSNIIGNVTATTGTLTLTSVTSAQSGYAYRAVFPNTAGSTTTAEATLMVLYPAPVLNVPSNIIVNATSKDGAVVVYNVSATDSLDGTLTPVCTPSSASAFPIGTTTVNCSATNSHGGTTLASFTVTVLHTFSAFVDEYGLSADPMADPNHTGVCNLAAYAFGVNPSAPDRSLLPSASVQNGYLQITYPQRTTAADLTYIVEVSSDLITWYSGTDYTLQVSTSPAPNDPTRQYVVVRDLTPFSNASRRFIRLKIKN